MKKILITILVLILIVGGSVCGFFLGKNYNKLSEVEKEVKLNLPVYEYNSAIDGEISYENIVDDTDPINIYRLSRFVPCEYEVCKWIPLNHSRSYNSNWIMFDAEDSVDGEFKGGYYFYNFKKNKKVAGPFEHIELIKPSGDWALRLVLVVDKDVYGLYDILSKEFVLPLDSNYLEALSDDYFAYEKDEKYYLYNIQGDLKEELGEYDDLEQLYLDYYDNYEVKKEDTTIDEESDKETNEEVSDESTESMDNISE